MIYNKNIEIFRIDSKLVIMVFKFKISIYNNERWGNKFENKRIIKIKNNINVLNLWFLNRIKFLF